MRNLLAITLVAAAVVGCASVDTRVTVLDPAQQYAPSQNAVILLDYPSQPYVRIALIESQGTIGGSETELLEDARRKAQALGADAIVRLEVISTYQPPLQVYDPWYGKPFYPRYRYGYAYWPPYMGPYPHGPYAYSDYRWVGGGNWQMLKAVAIKYAAANNDEKNAQ